MTRLAAELALLAAVLAAFLWILAPYISRVAWVAR